MRVSNYAEIFQNMFHIALTDSGMSVWPGTILDLPILDSRAHGRLNVMPRVSRHLVRRIAKNAADGSLEDMLNLSMMYSMGLGVKESTVHASSWAAFSAMQEHASLTFDEAVADLKSEVRSLTDDFVYPQFVHELGKSLLPHFSVVSPHELPRHDYLISPLVQGVSVFLIYRVKHFDSGDSVCHLYDMRFGKGFKSIGLDYASRLGIPLYLGSSGSFNDCDELMRFNYYERMQEYFAGPTSYIVIGGTLTIPKEYVELAKQHHDISSVGDLFQKVDTNTAIPSHFNAAQQNLNDRIEKCKEILHGIDKDELDRLRTELREIKAKIADYTDRGRNTEALKYRAKELRAWGRKVRDDRESAKNQMRTQIQSLERERDAALARYPEKMLEFVASSFFSGSRGNSTPVPITQNLNRHLASLGFSTVQDSPFADNFVLRSKLGHGKNFDSVYEQVRNKFSRYNMVGLTAVPVELGTTSKEALSPIYLIKGESSNG